MHQISRDGYQSYMTVMYYARFRSCLHKIVDVFAFQQIFSQTFLKLDIRTVCKCVFYQGILFLLKKIMPVILNYLFISDKVMMHDALIILKRLECFFVCKHFSFHQQCANNGVFISTDFFCSIPDKVKHVLKNYNM